MPKSLIENQAKDAAGKVACNLIQNHMTVGLGTGSTVHYFIQHLGTKVQNGLIISACATSKASEALAQKAHIPLIDINQFTSLDIVVDGADEIDPKKQMIKGGGGALLREKIVASMTKNMVVIIDQSKWVQKLGKFPLPVEILPFAHQATLKKLEEFHPKLRMIGGSPYITDNQNYIADLHLAAIDFPEKIDELLHHIPGVLETGLFLNFAKTVIVGYSNGIAKEIT
jgi:ribose 5-phosphate isomerase A